MDLLGHALGILCKAGFPIEGGQLVHHIKAAIIGKSLQDCLGGIDNGRSTPGGLIIHGNFLHSWISNKNPKGQL